jgi:hypothetical protein
MQNELNNPGKSLFEQIRVHIETELKTLPAHGKICFELNFRDSHLQRLLTIREVSRLVERGNT